MTSFRHNFRHEGDSVSGVLDPLDSLDTIGLCVYMCIYIYTHICIITIVSYSQLLLTISLNHALIMLMELK